VARKELLSSLGSSRMFSGMDRRPLLTPGNCRGKKLVSQGPILPYFRMVAIDFQMQELPFACGRYRNETRDSTGQVLGSPAILHILVQNHRPLLPVPGLGHPLPIASAPESDVPSTTCAGSPRGNYCMERQ